MDGAAHTALIFERINGFSQYYVDGDSAFLLEGIEGGLFYRNLTDGTEQELFAQVLAFFVDEAKMYAIACENDIPYLFIGDS